MVEEKSDFKGNLAAKKRLNQRLEAKEVRGYIEIPKDAFEKRQVNYYTKIIDFELQGAFGGIISRIVTNKRLADKGYSAQEVRDLMQRIDLRAYTVTASEGEAGSEGESKDKVEDEKTMVVRLGLAYVLIFSLYLFTLLYASSVMRSVLEEKTTRIVEVILPSIKPYQLLLGKIIGVCSVCLTMFFIWAFFAVLLLMNIGSILKLFGIQELPPQLIQVIEIIKSTGVSALIYFLIYFVIGFFLFSTLYAAIGAICNSDEEAQQVSTPLVMLLMIPFMLMFGLFRAPDSTLTVALSHIPFFSPILMFMRINVLTPPLWEVLLNIAAMIATVFVVVLLMGKIYKVGILMYGKRPTLQELWKWLQY